MPDNEAKRTAKAAGPKFDPAKIEVPELFREMAEQGVEQAKANYARLRSATEDATEVVEDTYLQATRGATEFNLKAIEALRANVNANFDYARVLLGAKSLSEAVEISTTHLREQFDVLSAQTKEMSALAQRVASDAAEPMQTSLNKTLKVD